MIKKKPILCTANQKCSTVCMQNLVVNVCNLVARWWAVPHMVHVLILFYVYQCLACYSDTGWQVEHDPAATCTL